MSAKRRYALENREAHRAQWRQQAEQRLAKAGFESSTMCHDENNDKPAIREWFSHHLCMVT